MRTECYGTKTFGFLPAKPIEAKFDGGRLTSDSGLLLLAAVDRRFGLTEKLTRSLIDPRDQNRISLTFGEILRQRIFGIAAGYEDGNDHDTLRADPVLKVVSGRCPRSHEELASQPTISRFENHITRRELVQLGYALVDHFLDRHRAEPPSDLVLDFDATDDPTHGQQQFEGFHGYYGHHCYLPMMIFGTCDEGPQEPILAVLRPGKIHAAKGIVGLLRRLIERIARAFPTTRILFRGDAGMATPRIYELCEERGAEYMIGLGSNPRLQRAAEPLVAEARALFGRTGEKVRIFGEILYRADSWERSRRVIVKAEVMASHPQDTNVRFVVTNREDLGPEALYDAYVQRGDVECRIDELKNDCYSGRTSCCKFLPNQFRLFMHTAAYLLFVLLRPGLKDPALRVAQVETLRVRLIKVAARVVERVRHVTFSIASNYPWIDDWLDAAAVAEGAM
jgi:hypothetical protein